MRLSAWGAYFAHFQREITNIPLLTATTPKDLHTFSYVMTSPMTGSRDSYSLVIMLNYWLQKRLHTSILISIVYVNVSLMMMKMF